MSEKEKALRECAARLRRLASDLEEADDLTPDEVTCHRDLGHRINQAEKDLRALAAKLERS